MTEGFTGRITRAAELIACSRNTVALTGAGISTPSGIPDFRSPESGLWTTADPMEVASIESFRVNPQAFYTWNRDLALRIAAARPNAAHVALAELETLGRLRMVITQNVDNLHQKAGSRRVVEVHGNLQESTCLTCGKVIPTAEIQDCVFEGRVPHCSCGGVYKPNAVFFGEMLPFKALMEAREAAETCDTMIVVGSSLEVVPAADMPWIALRKGASVLVFNMSPTAIDEYAEVVVRGDVAVSLPRLLEEVRARVK